MFPFISSGGMEAHLLSQVGHVKLMSLDLLSNMYFSLQGKGRIRRGNYASPSSPVVVQLPSMSDVPEETLTNEAAMETDITDQQQAAMQQGREPALTCNVLR